MQKVDGYEFKDLHESVQKKIKEEFLNDIIQVRINCLDDIFNDGEITEQEYYEQLGCSKRYADTTGWFVPSCFYEKYQISLDDEVKELTEKGLFTVVGHFIDHKREENSDAKTN